MFGNKDFSSDQGGFLRSPGGFTSGEQDGKKNQQRRIQNIFPVTVKQVLECPEDGMVVANMDVSMVTLVGVLKAVKVESTSVTYTIRDDTGSLDVICYTPVNDEDVTQELPKVRENTIVRLFGAVRSQQQKRLVIGFSIASASLNERTAHILEVMYCKLKAEERQEAMNASVSMGPSSYAPPHLSNSMVDFGSMSGDAGLTSSQRMVLDSIKKFKDTAAGASSAEILADLPKKFSAKELSDALQFLNNEGHIYCSYDEDHFKPI